MVYHGIFDNNTNLDGVLMFKLSVTSMGTPVLTVRVYPGSTGVMEGFLTAREVKTNEAVVNMHTYNN